MRVAVAVGLGLLLVTTRARADDENGIRFGTNLFMFQPRLANANFSGSGRPYGSTATESFSHSGREIGIRAPALLAAELRVDWVERHFEIGMQAFAAASLGDSGSATDPDARAQVNASAMTAFGAGIHAAYTVPAGLVSFAIGGDFGVRGFDVPLRGFEPTTCHSKYGTHACSETATYTQPYFQPRVAMYVFGHSKAKTGFFFGPWAGLDVVPAPSWAGGFVFGWGWNPNHLH